MRKVVHIQEEDVHIQISTESDITGKYTISTEGAIVKCIKHVYRYKEFTMPKDIMLRILWLAHKGLGCKEHHLDVSQRDAIYDVLEKIDVDDPHVLQFMKVTREMLHKGEKLDVKI